MVDQLRLLALCALRHDNHSPDWSLLAREAHRHGGLDRLEAGEVVEDSKVATQARDLLRVSLDSLPDARSRVEVELEAAARSGARLVTVLDADYPANLRLIPNLPPFLFIRGTLEDRDIFSVAVVGTRTATDAGRKKASRMAAELVADNVTVVSGLARGIDTAAHTAAIERGGRTIAVIGTGITKCYPPENRGLAERVVDAGAVVSQFWPTSGPATWTFPRRNVVMSGITQGTVVIEAGPTSGAKMQARFALEHGKQVFLLDSLVTANPWAQSYLKRGAARVEHVQDVTCQLAHPDRVRAVATARSEQLSLLA